MQHQGAQHRSGAAALPRLLLLLPLLVNVRPIDSKGTGMQTSPEQAKHVKAPKKAGLQLFQVHKTAK